jgi:glycerol-3-phosphate acyltransferase PlsY
MDVLLWALVGYVTGSLPSAVLAARLTGRMQALGGAARGAGERDAHVLLKEAGAGRAATIAAVADVLKGLVPVLIAARLGGTYEAASCAVGAVTGHCWPVAFRRFAGRGLSAAAGAFLAVLPVEMFIGGAVTGLGNLARVGGLASTIGFGAIPLLATWRGQPSPYRLAAWAIFVLILARRLEGVGTDVERGVPVWRAIWLRSVFDISHERRVRAAPPPTPGPEAVPPGP